MSIKMLFLFSGDIAGKSKPAKDCFDLYEEILTEEGTAKDISLKEVHVWL